jgi:hypothetical protein
VKSVSAGNSEVSQATILTKTTSQFGVQVARVLFSFPMNAVILAEMKFITLAIFALQTYKKGFWQCFMLNQSMLAILV